MIGLTLAASGHFPYAVKYSGAIVVANFNMAILMRNEVFGRLLYLLVNTLFAKVRANLQVDYSHSYLISLSVASSVVPFGLYIRSTGKLSAPPLTS